MVLNRVGSARVVLLAGVALMVGGLWAVPRLAWAFPAYAGSAISMESCVCNKGAGWAGENGYGWDARTCAQLIAIGYYFPAGATSCPGFETGDDTDTDGDGIPDTADSCPTNYCNSCDSDKDGDGTEDNADSDIDGDTIPNGSDPDIDGDGIPNSGDPCPSGTTRNGTTAGQGESGYGITPSVITDANGNAWLDSAECSPGVVPDVCYHFHHTVADNESTDKIWSVSIGCAGDTWPCYCGNAPGGGSNFSSKASGVRETDCGGGDEDEDGDGVPDAIDNCQAVANPNQNDTNGDGIGDVCSHAGQSPGCVSCNDECPSIEGMIRVCCTRCPGHPDCLNGFGHCAYFDLTEDEDLDGIPNGAEEGEVRANACSSETSGCENGSCMCSNVENLYEELTNLLKAKFGVDKWKDRQEEADGGAGLEGEEGSDGEPSATIPLKIDDQTIDMEITASWDSLFADHGDAYSTAMMGLRYTILFFFGLYMLPAFINEMRP
jgi:hypothetical protein